MARLRGISLHGSVENADPITVIGQTDFRDHRKMFGIRKADRRAHMYIIGKTGTGKSTLLENLARQDIRTGHGLALLDPHGDLVERLVENVPKNASRTASISTCRMWRIRSDSIRWIAWLP